MARLSIIQHSFLAALFGPAMGNIKEAAKLAGVSDHSTLMTEEMAAEIKKRADNEMLWSVPKAIHVMQSMLIDPEKAMGMDKLLKVCTEFLDRAGISKQERGASGGGTIGLVFLPAKKLLEEPKDEENNAKVLAFEPPPL